MATIKQVLEKASSLKTISDTWHLDAELLLASIIGKSREYLFTWPERELGDTQLQAFKEFCARRSAGEPVAYILGRQSFWDFELKVNPSVLIPRPETELLVEIALEQLEDAYPGTANILDLGTGSGAIALALAANNDAWQVTAVDSSAQALAVARQNAKSLQITNIEFVQTSWCDGLAANYFDLVAANPPYVQEGDRHLLEGSLPFEPISALVAGDGGLADIRTIAEQVQHCMQQDAWLLIEHGFEQRHAVVKILADAGYKNIECVQDLAKLDRLTKAQFLG